MKIYGLTDKGSEREHNEDSIGILDLADGTISVCAVCDGMGGAVGGKIASELACNTFLAFIKEAVEKDPCAVTPKIAKSLLAEAAEKANRDVRAYAEKDHSLCGMGCTLCAVIYLARYGKLLSVNVGDSRLYKITSKRAEQLTKDHSYVQYLLDQGEITEEEALVHPQRNLITRAIGIDEAVEADVRSIRLPAITNAYYLLCSDGLHGMISEDEIKNIVTCGNKRLEEKADELISAANEAGGYDNISVILLSPNEKVGEEERV